MTLAGRRLLKTSAAMDFEFVEELKNALKGIEAFMTFTLKRVHLKKEAMDQKSAIVTSVTELLLKLNRMNEDCGIDSSPKNDNTWLPDEEDADEVAPIPAQQLHNPTKVGLLEKKRQQGFGRQKNTRYCVIKDNVMYYYKNRRDKKQTGAIVLDGYDVRPAAHAHQEDRKKEYAFELLHPTKRHYNFVTEDEPALAAWIKALQTATNNQENINDDEQEDDDIESDDKIYDEVFQPDNDAIAGKRNSSEKSSEGLQDQQVLKKQSTDHNDANKLIQEESVIPPPPSYPPPLLPDHPLLTKRPSQSECFQAFASDFKLRLVRVDVPSVPKEGSQPQQQQHVEATAARKSDNKFVPTKPPRNRQSDNLLQEPIYSNNETLSTNATASRKKSLVPLPSSKSCRRKPDGVGEEHKTDTSGKS